jgi:micrococcal nuclease
MARKSKRSINFFGKRGGIGSVMIVVVILVLGFFNPELRDQIVHALGSSVPAIVKSINVDEPLPSKKQSPLKEGIWKVVHVADGDTLDVVDDVGQKYRIRLIGADTPETVKPNTPVQPFGPEASDFTKKKIAEAGHRVRVTFDGDQIDKYGRNLAMIYLQLPQGEVWLNELLVKEGLAHAQMQYRFSKGAKERLRLAENEAKASRRNIWSLP